ncbi:MAG TPA: hypothetical protein VGI78_04400 [Acetobacteraceae bacterium]
MISGFIILYVHYEHIGTPLRPDASHRSLAWSASLLASKGELLLGIAWTLRYQAVFYAMFCVLILSRAAGVLLLALWLIGIGLPVQGRAARRRVNGARTEPDQPRFLAKNSSVRCCARS